MTICVTGETFSSFEKKKYADNNGPSYTYTPAGRLKSRAWARGITTWYTNNNAGELWVVNYSDTTPDVTNSYDRRGRLTNVLSGTTSLTKTYNDAGNLLQESYTGGPLNGLSVTNGYDALLRRTNLSVLSPSFQLLSAAEYSYDDASQLKTVSDGVNSATYTRLANSPLVEQIVFATYDVTVMTTTKGYDFVNRLTNTVSSSSSSSFSSSFDYKYNTANQRTSVTNVDGSYWVYSYDSMGQVTSGRKYWSDSTPVAGQQFDYTFDDIGNRTWVGRDSRRADYAVNTLNQYLNRTVPGFVNVLGTATNAATVSLWSKDSTALFTATTRKGDYFRGEMPFNNATGAMWLTITNVAVLSNSASADIVTNIAGSLLLAKNLEAFTYDLDGNLTSDSLWTNVWNGENRRTVISSGPGVPPVARVQEQWTILADGRWVERIVSTNNGTSYYPSQTNRYVWDNQVLLAVLDHTNGVVVSFLRGLDLSGTLQGAGGVGGVLAVKAGPSAQCSALTNTTHFTCYDGNGNVTALMNAATGEESARYEYAPFAEKLRETGPMAKLNPIRFSTQYADDVTGDTKYLFRDYQADVGRWLSRDPLGERGSKNLYEVVNNDCINKSDVLGLQVMSSHCDDAQVAKFEKAVNEMCQLALYGKKDCCSADQKLKKKLTTICREKFPIIINCVKSGTGVCKDDKGGKPCMATLPDWEVTGDVRGGVIYVCSDTWTTETPCGTTFGCAVIHELLHGAGIIGDPSDKMQFIEKCLGCAESYKSKEK